jgi:hypothetical protein
MTTKALSIDLLRIDADTQARVKISEETVDDYAEVIENEKTWPMGAVDVFHDGTDYFVADGFHRTLAAIRVNRASLPCRIHKGTARDARIFGMTANDQHGLRMSRADKRACVEWLLDNGGKMTQVKIAAKAGVDISTVKRIVSERKEESSYPPDGEKGSLSPSADGYVADKPNDSEEPRINHASGDGVKPRDPDVDLGHTARPDEPASNEPPKREEWRIARSITKKTVEALMRALDDLNDVRPIGFRDQSLDDCRAIILELNAMG